MLRRRMIGVLLVALPLAAGLALLAWMTKPSSSAPLAQPDLAINKRWISGTFAPGNEVTYELYFSNWSLYPADYVQIVDILPAYTTYVSSSQPGFVLVQAGPDRVVWVKDHIAGFEAGWLSVTVRVDDDAPVGAGLVNRARILCLDPEVNLDNNESTVVRYVRPGQPNLKVTTHLWQNSNPIAAGNEIVYEIAAQNLGGTVANSVRITDTLPADCAYVSDDGASSGFTTERSGQTVVWTKAELAPADNSADSESLYVGCKIADDWTPDRWLENVAEISTADAEYSYEDNLSRWTYKPERDRRYGAAITSVDDKTMRLLSDGGFDYALYYLDWSQTEPKDNGYYWGNLDAAVWQAWRYNLRLVVRVDRAPAWARGPGSETAPPSNPDKLGEFLQAAAARWPRQPGNSDQAQVYGYVIWNEPNLASEWGGNAPSADEYSALLQAAWNGVKASSPDAWVISAGLATTNGDPPSAVDERDYLQGLYDAGAGTHFDYLGANPMGFASAPDDTSDPNGYNFSRALEWRQIMVDNGDGAKDMFGTESGWLRDTPVDLGSGYNWMKVSDVDQAHYLSRAYHKAQCDWVRSPPEAETPWMGPMVAWNLDSAAFYPESEERHWFSITDSDGDPLRSYTTVQNAATRGPADLWVEKDLIDPIKPGDDFRYTIRYTNIGGQAATGVTMIDTLPSGTEYVSDSMGGMLVEDKVIWDIGTVDTCTYEFVTLTLRLADEGSGTFVNRVEIKAIPEEPFTDDNVATVSSSLVDLTIHKSVTPELVSPGQTMTYTLVYSNSGLTRAEDVFIADVVPVTLTQVSYDSAGAVITPVDTISYTWQVADLAQGEGGTITIAGSVAPGASGVFSLTNTAFITTTSLDVYPDNNRSVASNTVDADPPAPPTLLSPADSANLSDDTPTLTWSASPSRDVTGYVLDLGGIVWDVGYATEQTVGPLADDTYTWTVAAYDAVDNAGPFTDTWSFTTAVYRTHLPLVMKRFVTAPDLVAERIVAQPDGVWVTIKNQGNAPAMDDFWVDVYIDPHPIPTAVNQIWNQLSDEGLVWGVSADLQPGEILTLTVGGDYYVEEYSHVEWPLAGNTEVYAQVDSANASTAYGAVLEDHEVLGTDYNNISGPVYPTPAGSGEVVESTTMGDRLPVQLPDLPLRQ